MRLVDVPSLRTARSRDLDKEATARNTPALFCHARVSHPRSLSPKRAPDDYKSVSAIIVHRVPQHSIGYLRQPFIIAARWNCARSATSLQNREVAALLGGNLGVIRIAISYASGCDGVILLG
jgi:hypothetical protein